MTSLKCPNLVCHRLALLVVIGLETKTGDVTAVQTWECATLLQA